MNNAEATEAIKAALVDVPDMQVGAVIVAALDALAVEADDAKHDYRATQECGSLGLGESVALRSRRDLAAGFAVNPRGDRDKTRQRGGPGFAF